MINIGNTNISDIKIGNVNVKAVYNGELKVWERPPQIITHKDMTINNGTIGIGDGYFYIRGAGSYVYAETKRSLRGDFLLNFTVDIPPTGYGGHRVGVYTQKGYEHLYIEKDWIMGGNRLKFNASGEGQELYSSESGIFNFSISRTGDEYTISYNGQSKTTTLSGNPYIFAEVYDRGTELRIYHIDGIFNFE